MEKSKWIKSSTVDVRGKGLSIKLFDYDTFINITSVIMILQG